jgi:hypothetical protein
VTSAASMPERLRRGFAEAGFVVAGKLAQMAKSVLERRIRHAGAAPLQQIFPRPIETDRFQESHRRGLAKAAEPCLQGAAPRASCAGDIVETNGMRGAGPNKTFCTPASSSRRFIVSGSIAILISVTVHLINNPALELNALSPKLCCHRNFAPRGME